jgi:uncharacterized protein (TIGR00369 family)
MSEDTQARMKQSVDQHDMPQLIAAIPYARLIGIECLQIGEQYIYRLPPKDDNLGNPTLPAIHGGVLGGFLETAGALHVMMFADTFNVPKVVDFSIDFLRPGRHRNSFARCDFIRQGRKIANVSITAWQTEEEKPIATARAHFLLS